MPDEYISREKMIADIENAIKKGGMGAVIGEEMKRYVLRQPAADVAEVVRCKDCESCRELNRKNADENNYVEGVLWCTSLDWGVWPDDFCSNGERREE